MGKFARILREAPIERGVFLVVAIREAASTKSFVRFKRSIFFAYQGGA
jgi:hypothetical protein